jgi:hypothetical protein
MLWKIISYKDEVQIPTKIAVVYASLPGLMLWLLKDMF